MPQGLDTSTNQDDIQIDNSNSSPLAATGIPFGPPTAPSSSSTATTAPPASTEAASNKRNSTVTIESASPLKKPRMTIGFQSTSADTVAAEADKRFVGTGTDSSATGTDMATNNASLYDAHPSEGTGASIGAVPAVTGAPEGVPAGKVLLLRRLSPAVNEKDIEGVVAPFCGAGAPKVFLQTLSGYAFVEFVDEAAAGTALEYLRQHPVVLKGSTVEVMRSKRDNVVNNNSNNSNTNNEVSSPTGGAFRVLLASISNIAYPVDLELLNFLFSKYGFVEKIVTFMKNPATFQALIQFADPEQASYALTMLSNRNIYDSCNSLQLQPSKLKELTVRSNNAKTWDFTIASYNNHAATGAAPPQAYMGNAALPQGSMGAGPTHVPNMPTAGSAAPVAAPGAGGVPAVPSGADPSKALPPGSLLPTPMNAMVPPQQQRALFMPNDAMMTGYGQSPHGMHPMYNPGMMGGAMGGHPHGIPGMPMDPSGGRAPHPYGVAQRPASPLDNAAIQAKMPRELREVNFDTINPTNTPLIIVYHLTSDLVDVTQLFNLFSLYGPVLRIKILRDKRDTALIQYVEPHFATLAFTYLQGVPMYSEESGIQICFSKNSEVIMPMQRPGESGIDCRTRCFFAKEQRYPTNEPEKYFRSACKPRCTLFVAGLPEDATESEVRTIFSAYGETTSFKFRDSTEMAKKKAAHIEMTTDAQAVKALCHLHDQPVKEGHNIKVAFSRAVIRP